MGKVDSFYFSALLLVFLPAFFRWNCSAGVKTGPLIRDLIKPEFGGRTQGLFLANYEPEFSVILNLLRDEDKSDMPKKDIEQGEFFVRAPNKYGLIAVVQYLQLRTQIRGPSREKAYDVCRDYVKFTDARGKESEQICGYLYIHDLYLKPSRLLGPRTFYAPHGEINLKVFIDKSDPEEMVSPLWNTIQITFTAVTECGEGLENKVVDNRTVRACYPNKTINAQTPAPTVDCISSNLFCDKVYHCGYEGIIVGSDEVGCYRPTNQLNSNSKDDSGSVSGIMIFFIFVGVVLLLVFVGAYIAAELNISFTSCPPRMGMRHGSSNTRIGKETDQVSSSNTPPSNYSNFTIEEGR